MTDPLSLTEAKRLAGTADTILLRATRTADLETPIGAFLRLDDGTTPAYLLESVEGGERLGRYSFLGIGPRRLLEVGDGVARTTTRPVSVDAYSPDLPVTESEVPDPLAALRAFVPKRRVLPDRGHAAVHRRRGRRPVVRRRGGVRAVGPAAGQGPGRRPARGVHRDGPRAGVRPPDPRAVGDRVAAHRGRRPRGSLPDRRAGHLRGPGADRAAQPGRDGRRVRAIHRDRRRRGPAGRRPGRHVARPRRLHPGGRAREGRHRGRGGDPGRPRATPVVRPPAGRGRRPDRRHRPLPGPAPRQPVAVPVLHADPDVRGRRRQPGAAAPGRRRPHDDPPDRRHAAARRDARPTTTASPTSSAATPRSAPST